ncbi:phosphodiester glycosidase family protein [Sutcliffiella horikoshii]|uniref:phosphodiester glycosidase family protein n=1 Tax=Sutcliffiella horikoshii TaxID=79883 RepID=UPI00384BCBF1
MSRMKKPFLTLFIWMLALQTMLVPVGTGTIQQPAIETFAAEQQSQEFSLGQVIGQERLQVASGVAKETMTFISDRGRQEAFLMDIDLENPAISIQAGLPNGSVAAMTTVREQANAASTAGSRVVGAVNGDFFNTSTGIPIGNVIHNGQILKSSTRETFGITENGQAIIGYPNPSFTLQIGDATHQIHHLNDVRQSNQLALYSPERKETRTNEHGTEVVLSNIEGNVHQPGTAKATVEKVIKNVGNETIPQGKLVLSGHGTMAAVLDNLQAGQEIQITTALAEQWQTVKEAIGGQYVLVKDGQKTNLVSNAFTTAVAPRTAAGIKADGSVFFIIMDGRQPGYSEGITVFELQDLMYELGAVEALNFDGGGSSTFVAREQGEEELSVSNIPSDGTERGVANSLLVVSTAETGSLEQLAIKPSSVLMLAESAYNFGAKGMDANYNPVNLGETVSWTVSDSSLGAVNEEGTLTAGPASASGKIIGTTAGGALGEANVTIVDELSSLTFNQQALTVKRGEAAELKVTALSGGRHVHHDPANLSWEIEGNIGHVDEQGVFHASEESAQGTITVTYKNVSDTMDVQVGKLPIILDTFEDGIDHWTFSGARYNSISINQTTYPEPARFGDHALQLNYDFTGTVGTSGAYAHPRTPIELEDYPEAIGMWVYGDGKGHWLRAQLRDGNNSPIALDFARNMDWTGWKYVEAAVPPGRALPLKMDLPVRLMETDNYNKNAGTIYVDNIRAVYGETNDDLENPIISAFTPEPDSVVDSTDYSISATLTDEQTGINPERVWMHVDGKEVAASYQEETGELLFSPDKLLLDGTHQVKIMAQDNFGNETTEIWQYEQHAGQPGVTLDYEDNAFIGKDHPITIQATQTEEISGISLKLSANIRVKEIVLDPSITEEQIVKKETNENGEILIELKDLTTSVTEIGKIMFSIPKDANGNLELSYHEGSVTLKGEEDATPLFLPNVKQTLKAALTISVDRASVGFPAVIQVKDQDGQPVGGADVKAWDSEMNAEISLGKTNNDGKLQTEELTTEAGIRHIQAEKETQYSFVKEVNVLKHLGGTSPKKVNVTFNGNKNQRNVNWTTSPLVTESVLEMVEYSKFEKNGWEGSKPRTINGESNPHPMNEGELQVHSVTAKGLKPGTLYAYRVGDGTEEGWSETATISLPAPGKGSDDFNFILMGDIQAAPNQSETGFGPFTDVYKKAKADFPDASFMMQVGDLIDDGNLYNHWSEFFKSMEDPSLSASTPIVTAVGNHENIGNGVDTFKQFFRMPQNGPEEFKGTVYSFDYGDAHIAVLNTETDKDGLIKQTEWLKEDMADTEKKWKIVMYHRSPYFSNPQSGSGNVQEVFPKAFDEIGVDLAISGHDHAYVRTQPMKNGEANDDGTTYVIAGSAGGKFYAAVPQPYMDVIFEEKTQVYSNISVTQNGITITAKTRDGRTIDEHMIEKK